MNIQRENLSIVDVAGPKGMLGNKKIRGRDHKIILYDYFGYILYEQHI